MAELGAGRRDWLLISVVLATLASLVQWLIGYLAGAHGRRRAASGPWQASAQLLASSWLATPIRLAYGLGIPAAALFWQGALTSRGLGLGPLLSSGEATGTSRLSSLGDAAGWTVLLTGTTLALVSIGTRAARRRQTRSQRSRRSLGRAGLEALYHQVHWAFYREPFILAWGLGWGCWAGAVVAAIETMISPVFWERLHSGGPEHRQRALVRAALLVASTQLFYLTESLPLTLLLDIVVGLVAVRWDDWTTGSARPALSIGDQ